jgi:putative hydrolase of HD superfamily
MAMDAERLERQLRFLMEIDWLKQVFRQSYVTDGSRKENDAEHSWHFALFALVLAEYANEPVDIGRVVRMALVHDIVEVDAGDVIVYDAAARTRQAAVERAAAERLFGMLPPEQGAEFRALWEEFEARLTPEARFAAALDRMQPVMLNLHTGGRSWREHGIARARVLARNAVIGEGSEALWECVRRMIEEGMKSEG